MLLFVILLAFCKADVQHVRPEILSHPNWKLLDRGDNCGRAVSFRIIGGAKATLGQYPWLARLGSSLSVKLEDTVKDWDISYGCGGTIISERYVLTAAHCCTPILKQVRLGEYDSSKEVDCQRNFCAEPVQDINVEQKIIHENYTAEKRLNDICLLRLAKKIQFNDFVSPICLPVFEFMKEMDFEGEYMDVAGWGNMGLEKDIYSDILMTVRVPVVQHKRCVAIYRKVVELNKDQICAGGELGKDSCRGDSGGPLMKGFSVNRNQRYFIIGVVNVGVKKCGIKQVPGIYSLVPRYMTWILDNIKQ